MRTLAGRAAPVALAVVLVAGCGPKPKVHFADSPTFHDLSGRVHAILQRDVDGDGLEDALVAERREAGFGVALLRQVEGDQPRWERACEGDAVEGDDLDAFRWLSFGERPALFLLVLKEDPEELVQSLAVVDAASCATGFSDRITLERPDPELLMAPAGLRGGAAVSGDGARITIVDDPQFLTLSAAAGELRVMTSARVREITPGDDGIYEDEHWQQTIARVALKVERVEPPPPATGEGAPATGEGAPATGEGAPATGEGAPATGEGAPATGDGGPANGEGAPANGDGAPATGEGAPAAGSAVPELTDGRDDTALVAGSGEAVSVRVVAGAGMALLELRHGCAGVSGPLLTVASGGETLALGTTPAPGSFVRGAGATQEEAGVRRDLLALETPAPELVLVLGPGGAERCLREVRAYTLVAVPPESPAQAPESSAGPQ